MENDFLIKGLKELRKYNRSEENLKRCEPFEQLKQKYIALKKQYARSFKKLNADISAKAYRREYSKGGETIHRGFYSPSSLDLVVSGCNRGRLYKRLPKPGTCTYEYIFDDKDNMICCNKYNKFKTVSTELFIYEQDKVYGLYYDYSLSFISECHYENGKLIKYDNALLWKDKCFEINEEIIEYENDLMKTLYWSRYTPDTKLLTTNKYTFSRDEEGYLSTYLVEQIGGPKPDIDYGPIICKVIGKRK